MKCGARVALGVAGGYFLGRTKKMKFALMLAGMAAGRRAGGPGELLAEGSKLIGRSPELTKLTDDVRGRLVEAGKQAAVAVATRQVEALTDRVTQRVTSLTDVADQARSAPEEAPDEQGEAPSEAEPEAAAEPEAEPEPEPEESAEPAGQADESVAESPAPAPPRRPRNGTRGRGTAATGTARRGTGTATRAAGKATGRTTRTPRTRRSDDD